MALPLRTKPPDPNEYFEKSKWVAPPRFVPPKPGDLHEPHWHPLYRIIAGYFAFAEYPLDVRRLIFLYAVDTLTLLIPVRNGPPRVLEVKGRIDRLSKVQNPDEIEVKRRIDGLSKVQNPVAIRLDHVVMVAMKDGLMAHVITPFIYQPITESKVVAHPYGANPPSAYSEYMGCIYMSIPTRHRVECYSVMAHAPPLAEARVPGTHSLIGSTRVQEDERFDTPLGVATDDANRCLFVADSGKKRVVRIGYEADSKTVRTWSQFGSEELTHPLSVHVTPESATQPLKCYVVEDKEVHIYHLEKPTIISFHKKWINRYRIRPPDCVQLTSVTTFDDLTLITDVQGGWIYIFNNKRQFLGRFGTERTVSTKPEDRSYGRPLTVVCTGPQAIVSNYSTRNLHLFSRSDILDTLSL